MRTVILAWGLLFVAAPVFAQPNAPTHAVSIHELAITGVSQIATADLQAIRGELRGQCCDYAETQEIRNRIVFAFQERGYFKTRINQFDVSSLDLNTIPPSISVAVEVNEGKQYRLNSIAFSSERAFSSGQLRQQFAMSDGDIFNVDEIRKGLENLRKLYASQGYINFTPVADTDVDGPSSTIKLTVDVDEGKQFRLGGLLFDGEEPRAGDAAKLLEAWRPMEGNIYDGRKIEQWWQLAASMLPPGARLERSLELRQDPASNIATALLRFPDSK